MTTSVLDRIAQIRNEDEQMLTDDLAPERNDYFAIAKRDYLGKATAEDADRLMICMQVLDLTDADFAETRQAIEQVCEAVAQAQANEASEKGSHERQLAAQRDFLLFAAKSKRAQRFANIERRKSLSLTKSQSRVRSLANEHPELFDGGEVNSVFASVITSMRKRLHDAEKQAAASIAEKETSELNRILKNQGLEPVTSLDK